MLTEMATVPLMIEQVKESIPLSVIVRRAGLNVNVLMIEHRRQGDSVISGTRIGDGLRLTATSLVELHNARRRFCPPDLLVFPENRRPRQVCPTRCVHRSWRTSTFQTLPYRYRSALLSFNGVSRAPLSLYCTVFSLLRQILFR